MAENILILVPKVFDDVPTDRDTLIATLREERFIANTIEVNGESHYRPGEEFMMLVTFLGCSPVVSMGEPGKTGDEFCHIAIEGPLEQPRFIAGDNIKIPRCQKCGHRFDNWQAVVDGWSSAPYIESPCPECGESSSATQLRWRKCAGFGRFFIKVWGIFESEAVPSPNLMALLKRCSDIEWQHFYIRNN
ncbi:MAG: hypothetical protein ABFS08_05255 [Pseudomonadota bacterium]